MADIRFDTGVQSFQINGGVSVEFNPTDSEFAKKLFSLFEDLESRQHEYAKRAENETDPKKFSTWQISSTRRFAKKSTEFLESRFVLKCSGQT